MMQTLRRSIVNLSYCLNRIRICTPTSHMSACYCSKSISTVESASKSITKTIPDNDPKQGIKILGLQTGSEKILTKIYDNSIYQEIPRLFIHAGKNNTKVYLTDFKGRSLASTSPPVEGYLNTRKKSTVACQSAGISIGLKAKKLGITSIRVILKGIGQGRLPCLQGIALSGVNVVSITDDTPIHYGLGRRPRKPPRK